jgi:RNA polymerase sigma-70 factor (ECF subfamily)
MSLAVRADPGSASSSASSDGELVARLTRGDRAALGVLYDRHAGALLATAVRMLRSEREANDLLHDVFLEAWEHAADYDGARGSVRTWLLVRLRSRALDRLGRVDAVRTRPLEDERDEASRLESVAVESVDCLAVRQALSRLGEDVRGVLELTYFDGFSAREIGAQLGVPTGTVKSRLARGLAALEELLSPEGRLADAE